MVSFVAGGAGANVGSKIASSAKRKHKYCFWGRDSKLSDSVRAKEVQYSPGQILQVKAIAPYFWRICGVEPF